MIKRTLMHLGLCVVVVLALYASGADAGILRNCPSDCNKETKQVTCNLYQWADCNGNTCYCTDE
jgi:hypothetical protein